MDNPKKLATCGKQDEDKQNTTQRNWQHVVHKTKTNKTQHRETGNMWYTRRRQTKHNTEKLATCGTQDEDKQNKNTTLYGSKQIQITYVRHEPSYKQLEVN
jgi:hypothetical protein